MTDQQEINMTVTKDETMAEKQRTIIEIIQK
jgi:hypothetical protein